MPVDATPPSSNPENFTDEDLDKLVTPVKASLTVQTAVEQILNKAETKEAQEKAIQQAVAASLKLIIAHVNVYFINQTRQALNDYNARKTPCPENDALWRKLKDDIQHIFQTAFSALPSRTQHNFNVELSTAAIQTSTINFADEITQITDGGPCSSVGVNFDAGNFNGSLWLQILYGTLSEIDLILPADCGKLIHQTPSKDIIGVDSSRPSGYKFYTIRIYQPGEINPEKWDIVDD